MKDKLPIFTEDEQSIVKQEIVKIVDKALKERLIDLAIDDVKLIAKELMPNLNRIIAIRVKSHFCEIGTFLITKFGDIEEGE